MLQIQVELHIFCPCALESKGAHKKSEYFSKLPYRRYVPINLTRKS